jgi:intein-encoded DNA endonuclease-like protein
LILTSESLRKEGYVCLLVQSDFLQIFVEWIFEPSPYEIFPGVVLETLLIKGSLKMLERQGIVENIS